MPLPQWLIELDIPNGCIDQRTSASERGRSFVIYPQLDDNVWRIKVDGCWLSQTDSKRVDYLFWGVSRSGKERLTLVELKGRDFGAALEQIESTLAYLYGLKPELRQFAAQGGICVYVVLSKGQGVAQRLSKIARMQKDLAVIVRYKSQRLEFRGVDELC